MLRRLSEFYFYFVLQRSLLTLSAVLLLVGALATQLPKLKIDATADALTLEHDRDLDYFREISKRYQSGDFLVVTYKPKQALFDERTLEHLGRLRDELLDVDGIASVNSILDVPLLYSPPVALTNIAKGAESLSEKLRKGTADFALIRDEFLNSPIYKDMLLGPDGKTTAILLNLETDELFIEMVRERDALRLKKNTKGLTGEEQKRLKEVSEKFRNYKTVASEKSHQRIEIIRSIVQKYNGGSQIFLGGVSMIAADMVDFVRSDIMVFGTGIVVFIIAILSFIFRRWQFVSLPLATCLMTLVATLGFLGAVDWRLTVISSNFVALLLIICLAITIHLIVRYREISNRHPQMDRLQRLRYTMSRMFHPCLYTLLTTIVAFASLVFSGIRPVIDFGWMMVIGICIAFILAFVVTPVGLALLPPTKPDKRRDGTAAFTLIFSKFTEKHGHFVLTTSAILVVISAIGVSQLKVENRFIDYFHPSTEIHQGMLIIDQQLGGTITLDIIIDKGTSSEITNISAVGIGENKPGDLTAENQTEFSNNEFDNVDPFSEFGDGDPFSNGADLAIVEPTERYWFTQAGLERVDQVHDYLESLSEVGKVQSLAMIYRLATDLNGSEPNDFELALARQALSDDIDQFLVDPYIDDELQQTRITMRVRETDPDLRRSQLLEDIKSHLTQELNFSPENVQLTGLLVLYNNMLQSLFRSQILSLGAVFIGIVLMFLVLFRSLALSLIALVPNALAAFMVLGGMGLAGIPLDMMNVTIAAIAIGIGVDDAIHYIYRFRHEFSINRNYRAAMHASHSSIGQAMYYTSVTVIVGFSILALSKFIPSIYFGLLTGLAMLAAILASLTLLPKLLLMVKPLGKEETT
ncbi:MAG: putative RND superfamily exporter protein [Cellvibrionaceae bacterium]|jgi:predicted RND superfamily exporter protein